MLEVENRNTQARLPRRQTPTTSLLDRFELHPFCTLRLPSDWHNVSGRAQQEPEAPPDLRMFELAFCSPLP